MKQSWRMSKCLFLIAIIIGTAISGLAQTAEITGYYQQYRDFSFETGIPDLDFPATRLKGGGFTIAQNLSPNYAMWTQFTFYGSVKQPAGLEVGIMNNLQGIRLQTRRHGPLRLYIKGGMGFTRYGFDSGNEYKFSLGYGAGAQVFFARWMGITFDVSQIISGLPNMTDLEGREKYDAGLVFATGLTLGF